MGYRIVSQPMVREELMDMGTSITSSRMFTRYGQPLGASTITARQKYASVSGENFFQTTGGPRARGDLGYPRGAQMLSGRSPLAGQADSELSDILEGIGVAGGVRSSLPPEMEAVFKNLRELGASAGSRILNGLEKRMALAEIRRDLMAYVLKGWPTFPKQSKEGGAGWVITSDDEAVARSASTEVDALVAVARVSASGAPVRLDFETVTADGCSRASLATISSAVSFQSGKRLATGSFRRKEITWFACL
jgi:hypothetical protein